MQTYNIAPNFLVMHGKRGRDYFTIHDQPSEDRPREKLISQGPEVLSVQELLAVILVTGTTKEDLIGMTQRIIREYGDRGTISERNPEKLSKELDIPLVKACQIVACGELGRRFYDRSDSGFTTIRNARDAYDYLADMRNLPKEQIRGLYLNSHNRIIRDEVISIGTVSANLIHPREVFQPAIEAKAVAVILAHNHPSGELAPSSEDVKITEQLVQAGKILGIAVLDHVIITKDSFISIEASY